MTYIVYFGVCLLIMYMSGKYGYNAAEILDDNAMIVLAILTAGEVIAWRVKK